MGARGQEWEGDPGLGSKPLARVPLQRGSGSAAALPGHGRWSASPFGCSDCTLHSKTEVNIRLRCNSYPAGSFPPSYRFCLLILTHCHSFNSRLRSGSSSRLPALSSPLPTVGSHVTFPGCVILEYYKSLTIILLLDLVSCVILKGNT